jgi:predicted double-glycine peptidase
MQQTKFDPITIKKTEFLRPINWLMGLVAVTLTLIPLALGVIASQTDRHSTWDGEKYNLGWKGVAWQRDYRSCGPAVITTLLQRYYRKNVNYYEVVSQTKLGEKGISLAQLEGLANHFGIVGTWTRVEDKSKLSDLRMPLVAHLEKPESHFVIVENSYDGFVLVADPARGRILYPESVFDALWTGRVFVLDNLAMSNAVKPVGENV